MPQLDVVFDNFRMAKDFEPQLGPILLWDTAKNLKSPPSSIGRLDKAHLFPQGSCDTLNKQNKHFKTFRILKIKSS